MVGKYICGIGRTYMDERPRTLMTSSHCLVVLRQDLWADNSIISSEAMRNVCVYQKRGTMIKELDM